MLPGLAVMYLKVHWHKIFYIWLFSTKIATLYSVSYPELVLEYKVDSADIIENKTNSEYSRTKTNVRAIKYLFLAGFVPNCSCSLHWERGWDAS